MISIERAKALLSGCGYTHEQKIEAIVDELYILARIVVAQYHADNNSSEQSPASQPPDKKDGEDAINK